MGNKKKVSGKVSFFTGYRVDNFNILAVLHDSGFLLSFNNTELGYLESLEDAENVARRLSELSEIYDDMFSWGRYEEKGLQMPFFSNYPDFLESPEFNKILAQYGLSIIGEKSTHDSDCGHDRIFSVAPHSEKLV